jgi:hypothetical protein
MDDTGYQWIVEGTWTWPATWTWPPDPRLIYSFRDGAWWISVMEDVEP